MATIVVGGLALDANNRLVEIDLGPGKRERLADTEAGKGEQHEQRVVARRLLLRGGEQLLELSLVEPSRLLGRTRLRDLAWVKPLERRADERLLANRDSEALAHHLHDLRLRPAAEMPDRTRHAAHVGGRDLLHRPCVELVAQVTLGDPAVVTRPGRCPGPAVTGFPPV
jgi:hypothetical protein